MSKPRRGKSIRNTLNWRGTCPACARTGVKLLWEKTNEGGAKLKICKRCNATNQKVSG